jgi:2-methylcitrate dehydratase PrpD
MNARESTDHLAHTIGAIDHQRLAPDVSAHASHVVLDTVGAMLAGSTEPQVVRLTQRCAERGGPATLLSRGVLRSDLYGAVLVNGTAATSLELDEGHRPTGHPAVYTLPAVLAEAERIDASGTAVLGALIAGYEAASRLARAARLRPEVHVHGAIAAVGASVGVAYLLGAEPTDLAETIRTAACLGLATPFSAATQGAMARNGFAAAGALAGLAAVDLAASGHRGPYDALETVFDGILGTRLDAWALMPSPAAPLEISSNYFKRHACCRYLHPTLDALERAIGGRAVDPDDVVGVHVECEARAVTGTAQPPNGLAARFSLPFAVATRIVHGNAGLTAFADPAVRSPVVQRLAARVSPTPIRSRADRFPAYVTIELVSGEQLAGAVERAAGDPPEQLSHAVVSDKFDRLAGMVIADDDIEPVRAAILAIGEMPSASSALDPLREALARARLALCLEPASGGRTNTGSARLQTAARETPTSEVED